MHTSKWGHHPCEYSTYRLLKQLNAWRMDALRRRAANWRWHAKQPQNRILWEYMGQERVNKGPKPEPPWTTDDDRFLKELNKINVEALYKQARTPHIPACQEFGYDLLVQIKKLAKEANLLT